MTDDAHNGPVARPFSVLRSTNPFPHRGNIARVRVDVSPAEPSSSDIAGARDAVVTTPTTATGA